MNRRFNQFRKLIPGILVLMAMNAQAQQGSQSQQVLTSSPGQHVRQVYSFSVQDAVSYADKNNVQIKNALLDYKIQIETNRGITAAAYPQVSGSLSSTYYPYIPVQSFPNFISAATYQVLTQEGVRNGSGQPIVAPSDYGFIAAAFGTKWNASGGLSLSQILFDGQVFVGLQARKASLEYAMRNADVTRESIKVNVYKVYYQLVVSQTQMQQIDANITRTSKLLNDAREMFKNGFAENLDVSRASVQLANLETQKLTTQRNIDNGYLGLKFLIGIPVSDSLALTDKITEEEIKNAVPLENNYKYTDRKDYQYLQSSNQLNEYNVKRYKYSYYPTANLNSQYSKQAYREKFDFFGKGDWFNNMNIGLTINIPIFDGFAKAANVAKAKLQQEQTKNQLDNLERSIDNDVQQARNNFTAAILTLESQHKNMDLGEQVYDQTKKKYEAGLGSTTDITTAQTDLVTAQTNYVNALYDAIIAKIDYLKATGKLP